MFKTKRIKELEEQIEHLQKDVEHYKKDVEDYKKDIEEYKKKEIEYQNKIYEADKEILSLAFDKKKYLTMEKYYKMDKEPSIEVQAKVLADIRLHDMEYKQMLEQIERCHTALKIMRMTYYNPYILC